MRLQTTLALSLCLAVSACSKSSPTAPTSTFVTNLAGLWKGTMTFESATDGECIGDDARSNVIGKIFEVSFAVTQNGTDLTVTESYPASGNSCTFAGATSGDSLSLNLISCNFSALAPTRPLSCTNGAVRTSTPDGLDPVWWTV